MQKVYKKLVELPPNDVITYGRGVYISACRGNEGAAILLNYLVFEASKEINKGDDIALDEIEKVTIYREESKVLAGLNFTLSKPTLIKRRNLLIEWGFIEARPYHQEYSVYFKRIAEAINNPPAQEKKKPRGRYAQKLKSLNSLNSEQSKDLESKQTEQESKTFYFESQMFETQSKKFETLQLRQEALEAALASALARIEYLEEYNRSILLTNVSSGASASPSSMPSTEEESKVTPPIDPAPTEKKATRKPKTVKEPSTPKPPTDPLTPEQRIWFDTVWCKANQVEGSKFYQAPELQVLNQNFINHLDKMRKYISTPEQLADLHKVTRFHPSMKDKGVHPGNMVNYINSWLDKNKTASKPAEEDTMPASSPAKEMTLEEKRAKVHAERTATAKAENPTVFWTTTGDQYTKDFMTWRYMSYEEAETFGFSWRRFQPTDKIRQIQTAQRRERGEIPAAAV